MKICVYAICKNESNMLDRWIDSVAKEADYVVVLDTGSTDDTYDRLMNYSDNSYYLDSWSYKAKIIVDQYDFKKELGIMRFDKARNAARNLVPQDAEICVVSDLDEIFDPGWSEIVKRRFNEGYHQVIGLTINYDENGKETLRYKNNRTHTNSPFWIWTRVIHEGIEYYGKDEIRRIYDENFVIHHRPDQNKDRSLYKELLQYSCKEYPKDPYYGIYYGIELSHRGTMDESTNAFRRCLEECDFSNCPLTKYQTYLNLASVTSDYFEALTAVRSALDMGYKTRRAYVKLADIYEKMGDIDNAIANLENALNEVPSYSSDWTDDKLYFDGYIEDRLSLFYYYQKHNFLKAIEFSSKALQRDPNNSRMLNNLKFYYEDYIKSKGEQHGK